MTGPLLNSALVVAASDDVLPLSLYPPENRNIDILNCNTLLGFESPRDATLPSRFEENRTRILDFVLVLNIHTHL